MLDHIVYKIDCLTSIVFSTVQIHFQKTLSKIGLPKMPYHNLRDSCTSFHLAMGTNPKVVQALLGHSSVGITLSTYSHLLPGVSEEAAKNIDKIFS